MWVFVPWLVEELAHIDCGIAPVTVDDELVLTL